jgi:biotin carboxylase
MSSPHVVASLPLLSGFGTVVPLTDLPQVAEDLQATRVSGIVTFGDAELTTAARLASVLDLPFHSVETARLLADKGLQRARLADRGVDGARFAAVAAEEDAPAAYAAVGGPAVLKPRRGAGSRNAVLVRSEAELIAAVRQSVTAGDRDLVLEEYLQGDPRIAGEAWGDYVSVESLFVAGQIVHLGVTGKPRLAEPFRETGAFFPSTLPDSVQRQAFAVTERALAALDVTTGIAHTELKLTRGGPRVIEVNGRLGGYVTDVYTRAGVADPLRLAMATALDVIDDVPVPAPARVAYQLFVSPPTWATTVTAMSGTDEVRAMPGVRRVDVRRKVGDPVDWRRGTASAVAVVCGDSADHTDMQRTHAAIDRTLVVEYAS